MAKIWVVLETIPDGNGLEDVLVHAFHSERDAKKAADRIVDASDSIVEEPFEVEAQSYRDWNEEYTKADG